MYRDVVDLREFYRTSLGQVALRQLRQRIRSFWPDLTGQSLLGLGYATPYLRPFLGEAERAIALMPATQGVVFWPKEGPGLVALAEEWSLPFDDLTFDRVMIVHGLEATERSRQMLREVWRVLAGGGRLLIVAANRSGLWSRTERTPFGHGSPYSTTQLNLMLRDNLFVPERSAKALFIRPGMGTPRPKLVLDLRRRDHGGGDQADLRHDRTGAGERAHAPGLRAARPRGQGRPERACGGRATIQRRAFQPDRRREKCGRRNRGSWRMAADSRDA
jgi:SAM-dependent methyltransferase